MTFFEQITHRPCLDPTILLRIFSKTLQSGGLRFAIYTTPTPPHGPLKV